MKALPFPCIRPVPEHAPTLASLPPRALRDRTELQERIEAGELVEDRNLGYYLYELSHDGKASTAIIAVCPLAAYENGTVNADGLVPDASAVQSEAEHLASLGCQMQPAVLSYPDQPVLDMIVGAAKTSSPIYLMENSSGDRQAIWEVTRREAVDALRAMLEQIPSAHLCGGVNHVDAARRFAQDERQKAQSAGTLTGKEPFNFLLTALVPESGISGLPHVQGEAELPLGSLLSHRVAK